MKKGTLITAEMLLKRHACRPAVRAFEKEWPDGAKLLKRNLLRAVELDFPVWWFINFAADGQMIKAIDKKTLRARNAFAREIDCRAKRENLRKAYNKACVLAFWALLK